MPVGVADACRPEEVDARLGQVRRGLPSEAVLADGADEVHVRAEPGSRDCLVGALATGDAGKLGASQVSPGLGRRGTVATRSKLIEPTTAARGPFRQFSLGRAGAPSQSSHSSEAKAVVPW